MPPTTTVKLGHETFRCRWSISQTSIHNFEHPYWLSVDITVQRIVPLTNGDTSTILKEEPAYRSEPFPWSESAKGGAFMSVLLSAAAAAPREHGRAAKLIIPRGRGYIVRTDFIPLRMVDTPRLLYSTSFAEPGRLFNTETLTVSDILNLCDVFAVAAGGLIVETGECVHSMSWELDAMEYELRHRLSLPWLIKERRSRQTLAFVGNYLPYPGYPGTGANHYSAANALDIAIVLLDEAGCWLEDPKYSHLRETFLPVSLKRDGNVAKRIIHALAQYAGSIDGIVTFHESLTVEVAKAAKLLSLPAAPAAGLEIAVDKHKTAMAEGRSSVVATSIEEALKAVDRSALQFPMIVKPCHGGSSEGVSRANDTNDLVAAIKAIKALYDRHAAQLSRSDIPFVIEEYCSGPEVDVNMVLYNGEILFSEICDEAPKLGDTASSSGASSFTEVSQNYPSRLPASELKMLNHSVHQSLLRMELRTGMFHCEARVANSQMTYAIREGLTDLKYREVQSPVATSSCWLLEVNPRPPGKSAADAVESTYGVDYVGLGLLFALNDRERIEALSVPFTLGPQYHSQAMLILADKGGIFDSDDPIDELLQRRPDLIRSISNSGCYLRRGDAVRPPGTGSIQWIAQFTVISQLGYSHLLELCSTIRREFRFSII